MRNNLALVFLPTTVHTVHVNMLIPSFSPTTIPDISKLLTWTRYSLAQACPLHKPPQSSLHALIALGFPLTMLPVLGVHPVNATK